jgi:CheY-like chemotaxis protein
MDGIEATAAIRNLGGKYKKLPVIALSANAIQGAKEMFLENGMNDFLSKPIETPSLSQILFAWLPPEKISVKSAVKKNTDENEDIQDDFYEKLDKVKDINTEIGLNRVDGLKGMYRDNLKLFHEKIMSDNDKMTTFINTGDFKNFSIAVHAMKSMLASVGAVMLSDLALKLETASKNSDYEYCIRQFPPFSQSLENLHEQLRDIFPEETPAAIKEKGDAAYLRETVQKAMKAVNNYDTDEGINTLNNVLVYDFGENTNTLLEKAFKALKQYQYDEAKDALINIPSLG